MWYMVLEIWSSPDFFVILSHFLPSYPLTAWKIKISKKKKKMKKRPKKLGDIITLQKCTKNHDHRLYCSWDMAHYRCNYFSIWAILLPFMPLTAQKMKISKKWKKCPEMSSFYTSATKIMIICYIVPEIWHVMDVIVIFHFGQFFALSSPPPLPTAQKMKSSKKWKKIPWIYHHLTQGRVIPCEFTRILKIFPPDPHGFSWNFVMWIVYPSRNENPENFIILSRAVQKLWPTEIWSFYPRYQTINFFLFWSCFYSDIFNRKHLKFGLAIHFHTIISKKIYLAKNFMKQVCAGVLKLPNLPLWCFSLHFQRAISWQGKI